MALNSSRSVDISPLLTDVYTPSVLHSWTLSKGGPRAVLLAILQNGASYTRKLGWVVN